MIRVEREEYLRQHPQTKANGYYERDLKIAIGTIEGLTLARSRDSGFHSALLACGASFSRSLAAVMALFAVGVCAAKFPICSFLMICVYLQLSLRNGSESGRVA